MTHAGVQMFMEKLKQLINCKDNPLINNPSILYEGPQFQLLYEELGSMIQTPLFIGKHQHLHELEKVNYPKQRFKYAAEEAEDIVDLFLSAVHFIEFGFYLMFDEFKTSLNLENVISSIKSIKVEFLTMDIDEMKIDSYQRTDSKQMLSEAAAEASCTRNSVGPNKFLEEIVVGAAGGISGTRNSLRPNKLLEEILVGLDHDVEIVRDKLVENEEKLDVVSIVGMGGIGKTTLATKVFNDPFVVYHFYVRAWVTVSQTFKKRDVLIQILASIGVQLDFEKDSDSQLREKLHKSLMGKRFLIVIDDIWSIEAWDNLKLFFPHDNTGSRILLTSRLTEVASHTKSNGFIHNLQYLTEEESWELLCKKVFHGNDCPEPLIKLGMQIAKSCQGLPLAVVVIAGVLAKEAWSKDLWEKIACSVSSYIVNAQNGCLGTLALSYNHLPLHLRECFLYLGGFPEDYEFQVRGLIWLWIAEGFIPQEAENSRSLEDIAERYLMDLVDRNLVIVAKRRFNDGVKTFKVHDLLRELCLKKAREERFFLKIERQLPSQFSKGVITPPSKQCRRMFVNKDIHSQDLAYPPTGSLRSMLWFHDFRSWSDDIVKYFRSFVLLRVLDLQYFRLSDFPHGMELLVHLRYLAIWLLPREFPSSICNLWSLQTLIYITPDYQVALPSNISNLVNLRHLRTSLSSLTRNGGFFLGSIEKPMKLQTISLLRLRYGVGYFQKWFPSIKALTCTAYLDEETDFKSLTCLEKLDLTGSLQENYGKNHITFPATLKTLTLAWCFLPWSDMSIIQSLPNLEVLKLRARSFVGSRWKTDEQQFRQLKFLRLEWLDIKQWEACSTSFPCLKQLQIFNCFNLEEIPLAIGDIPTLELIEIDNCSPSVDESVRRIREEQHAVGNFDLKMVFPSGAAAPRGNPPGYTVCLETIELSCCGCLHTCFFSK